MLIVEEGSFRDTPSGLELPEGWAIRRPGEVYHYFRAGASLCDPTIRFAGPTYAEDRSQPSSHECAGCQAELLADQERSLLS